MTLPLPDCLVRFRPCAKPRARLICFPYAGGNATAYGRWPQALADNIDLCVVELPGRGRRSNQAFATDMQLVTEELATAVAPLADLPLFFFGHSLGALLAFGTARVLRRRGENSLRQLFVSARVPPEWGNPDGAVATMTDTELIRSMRDRGGTPQEILADPDLMARLLPVVRADFVLLNSHRYEPEAPFTFPLTVLSGAHDPAATAPVLAGWQKHTSGSYQARVFDGDHFFINTRRDDVIRLVNETIAATLGPASAAPPAWAASRV